MSNRVIAWFSAGAASAVATKLAISKYSEPDDDGGLLYSGFTTSVVPTYCETHAEHPDSERFISDCEKWFSSGDVHNIKITRLSSDRYADTWDVWNKRRYLAGIEGALCTVELKVKPRLAFQRPDDIHVFGYTTDKQEITRAKRLREHFPELTIETPLIDAGLNKAACLAMVERAGIKLPALYALGFPHNSCLPCVKATSASYWALVRENFPVEFERMAKLSRELDVRLCRIEGERSFIDEIPDDHPTVNAEAPFCDFLCTLAEQEYAPPQTPKRTS